MGYGLFWHLSVLDRPILPEEPAGLPVLLKKTKQNEPADRSARVDEYLPLLLRRTGLASSTDQ
jgi:hypothetical protein